jgi:hypothetical protein
VWTANARSLQSSIGMNVATSSASSIQHQAAPSFTWPRR